MQKIYKIVPESSAPELFLEDGLGVDYVGKSLIELSPNDAFKGEVTRIAEWTQFYRVGFNAFALLEAAWEHCMEMYYVITENDIELLSVEAAAGDFRIIHPRQFLGAVDNQSLICDLTYASALFRIQNRDPREIFCLEGMPVRENEFKFTYERFGFTGLSFEEIWSG